MPVKHPKDENFEQVEKYSMSIYHFNLQYKAGDAGSYFDLIRASFVPFVKFFNENSNWKASLELQGHMIGFLGRHFPDELDLLVKLNQRDQIEIVNVHYSDQVYLAYPYRDMQMSNKFNEEIFERYGLKRSGVFFAQENFFGEGAEKYMTENGYTVALLNQHFYRHHHEDKKFAPYYRYKNIDALIKGAHGYKADDKSLKVEQRFSYWDDGELAFARGNSYTPGYGASEEAYENHRRKYRRLELQGYKMVGVEDYINRIKELDLKPVELGPVTDGSWNMRYYGGVYLWMGTYRLPWERDGEIRSETYRTRNILLATEKLVGWCEKQGINVDVYNRNDLKLAWKHMLLGEVSDSTGQTPVLIEIYYTPKEMRDCVWYCNRIIKSLIKKGNKKGIKIPIGKFIDTGLDAEDSDVVKSEKPLFYGSYDTPGYEIKPELENRISMSELNVFLSGKVTLKRARKRSIDFAGYKQGLPRGIAGEHIIFDLTWHPKYSPFISRVMSFFREQNNEGFTDWYDYQVGAYAGLILPHHGDELVYCPALMEDEPRRYNLDQFDFGRTWIGLPNGLIGLGKDTYVIKHNYFGDTHIAATLSLDNQFKENGNAVCFMTLNPPRKKYNWRFSFFKGKLEDAVALANKINVNPIVEVRSDYSLD